MNRMFQIAKRACRRAQDAWARGARTRRAERIQRLLAQPDPPQPYDTEQVFAELQRRYPARTDYGWDPFSTWWRGIQRAPALIQLSSLREPGSRVLEVACGDGMTGRVIASFGHDVTLHDLEDWRDRRARELPFVAADLCESMPLEPERFDLIFSYNSFEHISGPAAALAELVRLCRPGGVIYLDFGPLYASPWGLHVGSTLHMPYVQFLFSPDFHQRKIEDLGGLEDLGKRSMSPQPLNRWRLVQFEELWNQSGCEIISSDSKLDLAHLDVIERYPLAFRGMHLTVTDVTAHQISVLLRKPVR